MEASCAAVAIRATRSGARERSGTDGTSACSRPASWPGGARVVGLQLASIPGTGLCFRGAGNMY